jgi:hypothetical protein
MTKADQTVDSAADRLEEIVQKAQRNVTAKVAEPFAKSEGPAEPRPRAPSGPQLGRPKKTSDGLSPWVVIGAALAGGFVLAKVLDWRGHAHPRV